MVEPSLELLQGMIQQVLDQQKLTRYEMKQSRRRAGRVEQLIIGLRRDQTGDAEDASEVQAELDGLVERIERLAAANP